MTKQQKLLQQTLSALLFVAVLAMLGWLSTRYKTEIDWTAGHRNSLTPASVKLLSSLDKPIKFTAFLYSNADNKQEIQQWIERYRRAKKDVTVDYIDPASHPEKVKEFNIDQPGEIVVEYDGRRETLHTLSESAVTGALQRLNYSGERFIVFLEGHGERSLNGKSDTDFDRFAAALSDKGLKAISLNLAKTPKVPDNASVLVIASPMSKLLEGEVKIIRDYVAGGGNLLWLCDPENPPIDDLAKDLGVTWQNGYAIFPNYAALGINSPAIFLATAYPESSPVTRDLNELTAFPLARSLVTSKDSGWKAEPMLVTDESAWLEAGKIGDGPISFDPKAGDVAGPLTIGVTLTREAKAGDAAKAVADKKETKTEQRIALVGDSDFLADSAIGQLGNKQLGLNIVEWLATRDASLNIDIPKARDRELVMSVWMLRLLEGGFFLALPIALLAYGVLRWLSRRRA